MYFRISFRSEVSLFSRDEGPYDISNEPLSDYINYFVDKYDLQLPADIFFDLKF